MTYHVARNNQQLGTYSEEETLARYQRGEILPTDLVWKEGMANWLPASQVFAVAPTANVGAVPPPPPPVTGVATPMNPQPYNSNLPPKPDNNLVWAILATVLCCLPLGIVSIIFATQVDTKYAQGDYEGALASAKKAKNFAIWSAVGCVIILVLYFGFFIAMGISGAASSRY